MNGAAALYVCRNFTCQAPVTDPSKVKAALSEQSGTREPGTSSSGSRSLEGARLSGKATAGGTGGYAVRLVNDPRTSDSTGRGYTSFGSTGLTVSRLGFGGYRIETEDPEHREALTEALRSGWNLIDTSTNYTDGSSERLIGSVLADLMGKGELARDEVLVVSKIGYVQGQNLRRAEARERAGKPYPELVKYGEGIWHCIHPEFLADQLSLSLDRLGLDTLDACLLHNPEYFLSDAAQRGEKDLALLRDRFYQRLEAAFTYFETQVAAGRLQVYGVSSNTAISPPDDPESTSLSRMLQAAEAAARNVRRARHSFSVLQVPMNLFEAGAALTPNTGPEQGETVLELAQKEGIALLVNRPLNAMPAPRSVIIRLADLPLDTQAVPFDTQREKVAGLEQEYRKDLAPHVTHSSQGLPPVDYFTWAEELARVRPRVQGLEHWDQIENQMIAPHVNKILRALNNSFTGELADRWHAWQDRYLHELLVLLRELRREAVEKSRARTVAIAQALNPLLPEPRRQESLSRKALWVLASTPGVTCVLNGARTPAYVDDSSAILPWEPLEGVQAVYRAVQQTL